MDFKAVTEITIANSKLENSNQKNKSRRREQLMLYAPLLIWIGVIFFLSSSQGSMSHTSRIIRPLLEFLFPGAPEETLQFYHGIIRKLAHFAEYAVMGFLAVRAFSRSLNPGVRNWSFAVSIFLVVVLAVIDETTQSFNPARTGSAFDVMIDICGGLAAIGVFLVWRRRDSRRKSDPPA